MNKSPLILAAALALSLPIQAQTVVFNDTFANGTRTVQDLPDSAAWYFSGESSDLTATTGSMTIGAMGSNTIAYFTDSGAISVATGETIRLSFDFTKTGGSGGTSGIRIGLLNSNGSRITADGSTTINEAFNGYRGYRMDFNAAGTSAFEFRPRNSNAENLINSNTAWGGSGTATGSGAAVLQNNVTYTLTFSIEILEDTRSLSGSIVGGDINAHYTRPPTTVLFNSFDTIVLAQLGSSGFDTWTISNVKVEVIPEQNVAWYLGLAGLALVIGARHWRKRQGK